MEISEIWIYPIKSLGGIPLMSAVAMPKGLQFDRRYMLINPDGIAITQREFPAMALFKLSLEDTSLIVRHGDETLAIPKSPKGNNTPITAKVWDDMVVVHELSSGHSEWFSRLLNMPCRLVFFPEENPRPVDEKYQVNHEQVSLADAYPILVIGQSSLDDLNGRMETPLPMNRFRPNLVFTGAEPFAEDRFNQFKAGTGIFAAVKPCARCVLTTVDQETAKRGVEPLKTLAGYRSSNNKIYFGQNVLVLTAGEIKVGDPVSVLSYR